MGAGAMDDVSQVVDQRFWSRARRHMLGYGGDFVPFVPTAPRVRSCMTRRGRRVLDFTSGQMSAILGHSHPEIVATVREAVGKLDHLFSSMLSEPVVAWPKRWPRWCRTCRARCCSPPAEKRTRRRSGWPSW